MAIHHNLFLGRQLDVNAKTYEVIKFLGKGKVDILTWLQMVIRDCLPDLCLQQVKEMCRVLYQADTNIDYFPTNSILKDGILYYVDYECNAYMEEWNFENWGIKYWSKTQDFMKYVEE